eukprot:SM000135S26987  [mRNA]  locus=s135:11081:13860:- [translate_table: standard]
MAEQAEAPAPEDAAPIPNTRCFLDVTIDGEPQGRVLLELWADRCPVTAENFRALCTGEKGVGSTTGKALHFKGSPFHRVIKGFMIQGGDFSAMDGTGGESIYGAKFQDEAAGLAFRHDRKGLLSMANAGPDTNGSQFFITTAPARHLDGKHVVFGCVRKGFGVVKTIERSETGANDKPVKDILIADCGELVPGADDGVAGWRRDGDNYPDWPQDLDTNPEDLEWWLTAINSIKGIGNELFKKGEYKAASSKYCKTLRFLDESWGKKGADDERIAELQRIREACLLNNAACKLKLEDWAGALKDCDFALVQNPTCVKALFRKGQARLALNDLEGALEDLTNAQKHEEKDVAVRKELQLVKKKIADRMDKERKAYSKMFS